MTEAEAHFSALVLWQVEAPFSVGAYLLQLMQGIQETAEAPLPDCSVNSRAQRSE
ncbi:MAG: hypothetical protein WDM70_10805 [Nitrosomonadales bacterium]